MIRLDRLTGFAWIPVVTWNDLVVTYRQLRSRLPTWGIYVGPVSSEWCERYERESVKR